MTIEQTTSAKHGGSRERTGQLVELLNGFFSTVLNGRLLDEATGGELTPVQYEALAFIHRHGGCSAKALSEGLRISIPSSTRLVDRLERKQLVDRRESGVDRRLVRLTMTPVGESTLAAVREVRIAFLQRALGTLPDNERATFQELLEKFLQAALCDEQTVKDCCRHCGTDHDRECVVNEAHFALLGKQIEQI